MSLVLPFPLAAAGYPLAQEVQTDFDTIVAAINGGTGLVTSITGTANQVVASASTGAVTLSLPQSIAAASTPTFASETLTAVTNQLVLGTTRTVTLTAPTPATTSRVVTFPDLTGDYSVVGTIGTQTVAGAKTFTSALTMSGAGIAMGTNKITGLAAASSNGDAVRWEQITGQRVIQVVNGTTSTSASSASNTYVDTNLTATITPTTSTSKILVIVQQATSVDTAGSTLGLKILRAGSAVFGPTPVLSSPTAFGMAMTSLTYFDSPATTSATIYKTQFASASGAGTVHCQDSYGGSNGTSSITLIEVG